MMPHMLDSRDIIIYVLIFFDNFISYFNGHIVIIHAVIMLKDHWGDRMVEITV